MIKIKEKRGRRQKGATLWSPKKGQTKKMRRIRRVSKRGRRNVKKGNEKGRLKMSGCGVVRKTPKTKKSGWTIWFLN